MLSNIVLDELDQELEKRGLEFCRFADDCNIFVQSRKAAERVMDKVSQFIEKKLKLKVNREKSQVAKSDQVKFSGFTVVNGTIAIAHQALQTAMSQVKALMYRIFRHFSRDGKSSEQFVWQNLVYCCVWVNKLSTGI